MILDIEGKGDGERKEEGEEEEQRGPRINNQGGKIEKKNRIKERGKDIHLITRQLNT